MGSEAATEVIVRGQLFYHKYPYMKIDTDYLLGLVVSGASVFVMKLNSFICD